MARMSAFLLPALAVSMAVSSCSKEMNNVAPAPVAATAKEEVVQAAVLPGTAYTLAFDPSTTLNIRKQASHFQVSSTSLNNETGKMIYTYIPSEGFAGEDEVTLTKVLTVQQHSSGVGECGMGSHNNNSNSTVSATSLITVKLTVSK